jgi:hypothetical protein
MGVHLDEGEIASLELQLQKIFKKQLGFFDDEILSSTVQLINKVWFISRYQRQIIYLPTSPVVPVYWHVSIFLVLLLFLGCTFS